MAASVKVAVDFGRADIVEPFVRHVSRRHFLKQTKVAIGGSVALSAAAYLPDAFAASDPTKQQGGPARGYGDRASYEHSARLITPVGHDTTTASYTPLQDLHGSITPSSLHYERHHAGVPQIEPKAHRLLIHGLVERPLEFTMSELQRFPAVSRVHFLECSGNSLTEWAKPTGKTVQETHGLTSCSEWTGVLLASVLKECGIKPSAAWVLAEGADGARMTRSLPLDKCMDDVILAYAQNGEMLRPEQGYPLRLIVPGWEGSISVKWLCRLKVVEQPYQTREETSKYTDLMPDGTARQFTFVMEAKSVITFPSSGQTLPGPGFYEIRGLAWSGHGRVTRVDVSVDGSANWAEARLQDPVLPMSHTRFYFPWRWDGTAVVIASRCVDETGYQQPTREALQAVRGVNSFYHYNGIQCWRISPGGAVANV